MPSEENDPLELLHFFTYGLIRSKSVKVVLIVVFIFHGFIILVQTIDLITTFDSAFIIQYGPLYLTIWTCITNISVVFSVESVTTKLLKQTQLYSNLRFLQELYPEICNKPMKNSKFVEAISLSVILFITGSFFLLFYNNSDSAYGIMLFKTRFEGRATLWCIIFYYATFPVLSYAAFVNGGFVIHILMLGKIYVQLTKKIVQELSRDDICNEQILPSHKQYQEKVFNLLRLCIKSHQAFKMMFTRLNNLLLSRIIILLFLATASIICQLFILLVDHVKVDGKISLILITAAFATPTLITFTGQALKDEYEELYSSSFDCSWINWNLRNQKMFLIFLTNLYQSFSFGYPGIILCEYSSVPIVLKYILTFCMFIVQVVN